MRQRPGLFRVFLIAEHHQWQFFRRTKHFDATHEYFDLACRQLGVYQLRITCLHLTINADTPFGADLLDLCKCRRIRIAKDLCDAVMVAQVDEQDAAVVTHAINPTGQANSGANISGGQVIAGMRTVCVHYKVLKGKIIRPDTPLSTT